MPDGDYGFESAPDELADVARRGAREWERDMAAWESDAERLRLRGRTLPNVLWEAMQRGDDVTVRTAGHAFTGRLEAARNDLAVLVRDDLRIALSTTMIDALAMTTGGRGVAGDRTYGSFRAYLGMLEVEGPEVRLIGRDVDVRGRVEAVAKDHVLVVRGDGTRWAIALESLAAVLTGI